MFGPCQNRFSIPVNQNSNSEISYPYQFDELVYNQSYFLFHFCRKFLIPNDIAIDVGIQFTHVYIAIVLCGNLKCGSMHCPKCNLYFSFGPMRSGEKL